MSIYQQKYAIDRHTGFLTEVYRINGNNAIEYMSRIREAWFVVHHYQAGKFIYSFHDVIMALSESDLAIDKSALELLLKLEI